MAFHSIVTSKSTRLRCAASVTCCCHIYNKYNYISIYAYTKCRYNILNIDPEIIITKIRKILFYVNLSNDVYHKNITTMESKSIPLHLVV